MRSHKALDCPLADFSALVAWHDIEMKKDINEAFVVRPDGFDILRDYIAELDHILITGKVSDFQVLRTMRNDLDITRKEFVKLKMEGLYEDGKGGEQ